ncbi:MAG TPA: hypothetical protein VK021_10570 [Flavobacteriaceae bacterium]|nr:hypothetical protein [Flavobacteriaceae bacterium]
MSENNSEYQDRPKPFSKERTKIIVNRIIYFYSFFYVLVKVVSAFQAKRAVPFLMVALPFLILTVIGFKIERSKNYSWVYIVVGIILISVMRYYETEIIDFLDLKLS